MFLQNANAQAALQAAHVVMGSDEQSTILRVIVDNAFYPVSLEILHQVFILLFYSILFVL